MKKNKFVEFMKKSFIYYFSAVLACLLLMMLFKLNIYSTVFIMSWMMLLFVPYLIKNAFLSKRKKRNFEDINIYIEKMLYFFEQNGKIIDSLNEVNQLLYEGDMKSTIESAIMSYNKKTNNYDYKEKSLEIIAQFFDCDRIESLHSYLLAAEENGGNYSGSIQLLLDDRKAWQKRVLTTEKKMAAVKGNIIIAIMLTLLICSSILHIPDFISNMKIAEIGKFTMVQISSVLLIIFLSIVYMKGKNKLSKDWLDNNEGWKLEKVEKQYTFLKYYNNSNAFKHSILLSFIPAVLSFFLYLQFKSTLILMIGMLVIIFMLNQHTIGYNLSCKLYKKEVQKFFPLWLMNVSLLMQSESVRVSIKRSNENVPAILKPALTELINELEEKPDSDLPYKNFLSFLNMLDIKDAMYTLYSISSGLGGNVEKEFSMIIERIISLRDNNEIIRLDDKAAMMNLYVIIPSLFGAIKLMLDMAALLLVFFKLKY